MNELKNESNRVQLYNLSVYSLTLICKPASDQSDNQKPVDTVKACFRT